MLKKRHKFLVGARPAHSQGIYKLAIYASGSLSEIIGFKATSRLSGNSQVPKTQHHSGDNIF